ncbi:hypothetical protein EDC01DRAFT_713481 [Geopyxis carbonaria]|nr:hypothetical protein EDC01DRAFT_713481 [Geopyxis carbonaria]
MGGIRRYFAYLALVLYMPSDLSVFAAPLASRTISYKPEPVYVPEPRGRGTVSLLQTCITTFALCVWTAMHPNLPRRLNTVGSVLQKLHWMILAAMMPEFIVLCAFSEWREAKHFQRKWCEKFNVLEPGSEADTMGAEGGFFVAMGGFYIQDHSGKTLTITPQNFENVLQYLEKDSFHKKDIVDKGKASNIAKCLVCLQAGWMIVQCIARKVDNLPITLLEIHVVIQVVMSAILYAFWWSKPLDVGEPIRLRLKHDKPLTDISDAKYIESSQEPLNQIYSWCKVSYEVARTLGGPVGKGDQSTKRTLLDDERAGRVIAAALSILNGACHASAWNSHFPSPIERLLWQISSLGIIVCPILTFMASTVGEQQKHFIEALEKLRYESSGSIENSNSSSNRNPNKPLRRRDIFYRVVEERRAVANKGPAGAKVPRWKYYFILSMIDAVGLLTVGYISSILFLTVEAFLSMRSLPEGAYTTPTWTAFWPHL